MKRATKWLAFTVIMAMLAAALLALPAGALAQETSGDTTAAPATTGRIEMVVWSDLNGNSEFDIPQDMFGEEEDEGIDGIEVVLSREVWDAEAGVYKYEFVDKKKTGPGSLLNNPAVDYKHGCVVWEDLPLNPPGMLGSLTNYKLDLVINGTFVALNGGTRIATLTPWSNYMQYFLPLAWHFDPWDSPQINETTATISGYVWADANANQIIEWSEFSYFPQQGWTVMLTNKYGSKIATTTTDVNGYYYFRGLKPGTYKVWVLDKRYFNQTAPYYKFCTWPPWGYNKGHYTINVVGANRYRLNNFGMLDMRDSVWAPLYYALWYIGLLQYQFK
ncbi:MAG: SdrD B-like domain-containing protein [Actinomycetota bacterium]